MTRHIVARTSDIPPGDNKVVGVEGRGVAETFAVHVEDSDFFVET